MPIWKKANADGTAKTCKFCHADVWWDAISSRWYNPGGEVLHVETCELRAQHFRDVSAESHQLRRDARKANGG